MKLLAYITCLSFFTLFLFSGCGKQEEESTIIKDYQISRNDVIDNSQTRFDDKVSYDENGSLVINAASPEVIHLYETGDIDVENAQLVYKANVKTEGVSGNVFLEMWCDFGDKGEYFSRGLQSVITGTEGWKTLETVFFLKKGENPDNVKLNVAIDGKGIVWVDDLKLIKRPFNYTE